MKKFGLILGIVVLVGILIISIPIGNTIYQNRMGDKREKVIYGDEIKTWECKTLSLSFCLSDEITENGNGEIVIHENIYSVNVLFGIPNYEDMIVYLKDEQGQRTLIGLDKVTILSDESFKARVYYSEIDEASESDWILFTLKK